MRRVFVLLGALVACRGANAPAMDAAEALQTRILTVISASHDDDSRSPRKNLGTSDYDISGSGTAFVMNDGRVLTAAHCLHDRTEVDLRDHDGNVVSASLDRLDERIDVAVLLPKKPLPSNLRMDFADRSPALGAPVFVVGSTPFGFPALAQGSVTAYVTGRFGEAMGPMTLTNVVAWHGMSGSPMITMDDGPRVIGVAVGFLDLNFSDEERRGNALGAASIEDIQAFLADRPAPTVSAYATYAKRKEPGELGFEVTVGERSTKHRWLDLSAKIEAKNLEGDVVVLRPYVLDGLHVVGEGHPCFWPRARGEGVFCRFTGHLWAPHAGTYDVVLVAGSTPIAWRVLEIPG